MTKKIIIGKEEWCSLPNLNLPAIKARVDSGAKTSSLHAFNIYVFEEQGASMSHLIFIPFKIIEKLYKIARRK